CPGSVASSGVAGHYAGQTTEKRPVSFDVASDGRSISKLSASGFVNCTDSTRWGWRFTFTGQTALTSALRFSRSFSGTLTTGGSLRNVKVSDTIGGVLDGTGGASGTFTISHLTWDQDGKHYDCLGSQVAWTARR